MLVGGIGRSQKQKHMIMQTDNHTVGPSLADFRGLVQNMSPTSRVALAKDGGITTIGLWQRCKRFFSVSSHKRGEDNVKLAMMLKAALEAEGGTGAGGSSARKLERNPTILSARRINRILRESRPKDAQDPRPLPTNENDLRPREEDSKKEDDTGTNGKGQDYSVVEAGPQMNAHTSTELEAIENVGDDGKNGEGKARIKKELEAKISKAISNEIMAVQKTEGTGSTPAQPLSYATNRSSVMGFSEGFMFLTIEGAGEAEEDWRIYRNLYEEGEKVNFPQNTVLDCRRGDAEGGGEETLFKGRIVFINEDNDDVKHVQTSRVSKALFPPNPNFVVSKTSFNEENQCLKVFLKLVKEPIAKDIPFW